MNSAKLADVCYTRILRVGEWGGNPMTGCVCGTTSSRQASAAFSGCITWKHLECRGCVPKP